MTRHAHLLRDDRFWAIFHRSPEGNDYYKTAMLDGPMNLSKFLIPDTFVSTGEASDRHGRRTDLGDAQQVVTFVGQILEHMLLYMIHLANEVEMKDIHTRVGHIFGASCGETFVCTCPRSRTAPYTGHERQRTKVGHIFGASSASPPYCFLRRVVTFRGRVWLTRSGCTYAHDTCS